MIVILIGIKREYRNKINKKIVDMDKLLKKQIPSLTQIQRVWVLGINIAIAFILYFFSINFL